MADNNQFLIKEYELCFEQLRFYDTRSGNLLKFLFTLTTSVATAQFAIYKLNQTIDERFYILQTFLSTIVLIASILLFLSMLQNRLYFVYIARQINAIRGFLLKVDSSEFKSNQLYTSTNFPALKPFSVHTFHLLGSAMLCGLYAGSLAYGINSISNNPDNKQVWALCVFIATSILLSIIGAVYLSKTGSKEADEAIHGKDA
ncbi:MAG: hypothetical protein KAI50_14690 [Desulfobacterales bacterium]|nr:hypothetical protein [Desulfobacterales bacterium]